MRRSEAGPRGLRLEQPGHLAAEGLVQGVAQRTVSRVLEFRVAVEDGARQSAGPDRRLAVTRKFGDLEIGQARLARAEELALAADLEVPVGQDETVVGLQHRLEARVGVARRRLGKEQAVRL